METSINTKNAVYVIDRSEEATEGFFVRKGILYKFCLCEDKPFVMVELEDTSDCLMSSETRTVSTEDFGKTIFSSYSKALAICHELNNKERG